MSPNKFEEKQFFLNNQIKSNHFVSKISDIFDTLNLSERERVYKYERERGEKDIDLSLKRELASSITQDQYSESKRRSPLNESSV